MFLFFRTIKNRNRKKIAIGLKLSNFQISFIILQINVRRSRPSSTNADRCLYGNGSFFTCALISSRKTWTLVQLDSGSGLGPPLHPTSIRPSAGNTVTWPPKGGWGGGRPVTRSALTFSGVTLDQSEGTTGGPGRGEEWGASTWPGAWAMEGWPRLRWRTVCVDHQTSLLPPAINSSPLIRPFSHFSYRNFCWLRNTTNGTLVFC